MKIVITSHRFYPDIGGIETITEVLANFLVRMGHQVRVITGSPSTLTVYFTFSVYRSPSFKDLLYIYSGLTSFFKTTWKLGVSGL